MPAAGAAAGFTTDHVARSSSRRSVLRFRPRRSTVHDATPMLLLPAPPPLLHHDQLACPHTASSAPTCPCAGDGSPAPRTLLLQHQQAALSLKAPSPPAPYRGSLYSAVVLAGSRFSRPAQQLLDDVSKALLAGSGGAASSSLPSPSLSSSMDNDPGEGSALPAAHRREHRRQELWEKKARLLHLQDEVRKRHKQYREQIQMAVSSFESIPGLSRATPYASSVLGILSRHFEHIRSMISRQIQYTSRLLGEDALSLSGSSSGGEAMAITEHHQKRKQATMWKPKKGQHSDHAVSVLKAWLFDNFLRPYPSDQVKRMLATRSGLSRNQVSNWFINARGRLWRPMVEEMLKLETNISSAARTVSSTTSCTCIPLDGGAQPWHSSQPPSVTMAGGHHQMPDHQQFGGHIVGYPVG